MAHQTPSMLQKQQKKYNFQEGERAEFHVDIYVNGKRSWVDTARKTNRE